MTNVLTLEMLDDGTVIVSWQSGPQELRSSVPSMAGLATNALFAAFQTYKSGTEALPIMQNLAVEMSQAIGVGGIPALMPAPPAPPAPVSSPTAAPVVAAPTTGT